MAREILISHSREDTEIAEAMVNIFTCAFYYLPYSSINCTSVPRFTLPTAPDANTRLATAIQEPNIFVGLITPASIASLYVAFELGARWGMGRSLIPVVAAGISADIFRAPLSELPVVNCAKEEDLVRLVEMVAQGLEMQPERSYVYQSAIHHLMEVSEAAVKRHSE